MLNVATPLDGSVIVFSSVVPVKKLTEPVGVPFAVEVTVAVRVTGIFCPGLAFELTNVVVVATGVIVNRPLTKTKV